MATYIQVQVTNAGVTQSVPSAQLTDIVYIMLDANLVLADNVDFNTSDTPPQGQSVTYVVDGGNGSVDLNGFYFRLNGVDITQEQLQAALVFYNTSNGTDWLVPIIISSQNNSSANQSLSGAYLVDGSVPFDKLGQSPVGSILIANGPDGFYTDHLMSGDVDMSNLGVTTIANGAITNAKINASAAIARTKLASGTASQVLINDGSGVMTSEAQLAVSRGGTGQDFSASTGFLTVSSGTASVGTLTDVARLDNVSFVTANQGTYYLYFPFACTVTNINVRVVSVVAGTDDGSLTLANNSGTVMAGSSLTAGVLTIASGAAFGTGYSSTLTSNNTFTAGQSMRLATSKVTSGGLLHVDVTYTRNQ